MTRRLIGTLILLGLVLLGCSESSGSVDQDPGESSAGGAMPALSVIYHGPVPLEVVDPNQSIFTFQTLLAHNVFQSLALVGPEGELELEAAASMDFAGSTALIVLRSDLVWSDGEPVVASDFGAGLDIALAPSNAMAAFADEIVGWSEIDARTLEITTVGDARDLFTRPDFRFFPMPGHEDISEGTPWGEVSLVSNGRYVISPDSSEDSLTLIRNERFNGTHPAKIDTIVFTPDKLDSGASQFARGEIDLLLDVPFKQLGWTRENLADAFVPVANDNLLMVSIDTRKPEFDDPRVRLALALAVSPEVLADTALGGAGGPVYTPLPPTMTRVADEPNPLADLDTEARLDLARSLLSEVGYTADAPLQVTLGYFDIVTFETVARALEVSWDRIGVDTTVEVFAEGFTLLVEAAEAGDTDANVVTWSLDAEVPGSDLAYLNRFEPTDLFHSFYGPSEYRALLEPALTMDPSPERDQVLRDAELHLLENTATLPVGWFPRAALVSDLLHNEARALVNGSTTPLYRLSWQSSAEGAD